MDNVVLHTKTSDLRIGAWREALSTLSVPGDIVECGVWRGGNIVIARQMQPERTCWLYDTFTGMVEPTALDETRSGRKASESYNKKKARGEQWAAASVEEVRKILAIYYVLDDSKLRFVVGKVEDTLKLSNNLPKQIALLRLDTDWHASTKVELEVLYPLLAPGGVLIIDDYGHWMGARKAVDDYFGQHHPKIQIDYTAIRIDKPC